MNVFQTVKENVSALEAAKHYGLKVGRNKMCVCPFHNDKHPSMKVDDRKDGGFYCFGCQECGDVITLVAKLFNLSNGDAAKKLASDFGLTYDDSRKSEGITEAEMARKERKEKEREFQIRKRDLIREIHIYMAEMSEVKWSTQNRAMQLLEGSEAYVYAIHHLDKLEDDCNFLMDQSDEEVKANIDRIEREVRAGAEEFRRINRECQSAS